MSTYPHYFLNCETKEVTADNATEATAVRVAFDASATKYLTKGALVGFRAHQKSGTVGASTFRFYGNQTRTELLAEFTFTSTGAGTSYTAGSDATQQTDRPKPFFDGLWFAVTHASAADAVWQVTPEVEGIKN